MPLDMKSLPTPTMNNTPNRAAHSGGFGGINEAETWEKGSYFNAPGTFNAEIVKVMRKVNDQLGKDNVIIEFLIKDILVDAPQKTVNVGGVVSSVPDPEAAKLNEKKTIIVPMNKNRQMAYSTLKQFALAVLGPKTPEERLEAETKVESALDKAVSDDQYFKGEVIKLTILPHWTQGGKDKPSILIHIPKFQAYGT